MRLAIKFAYDGIKYYGFARQPKLKTVEGEIIEQFRKNNIIKTVKDSVFKSASRTDKFVSAFGNVIAFDTNCSVDDVLNVLSDGFDDIVFYSYSIVSSDFYPRHAWLRYYRYFLELDDIDVEKITRGLSFFTGKHDFSNFARVETGKNPIRSIHNIVFEEKNDFLIIDFFAQTFLRNQIRRIISSLVRVGLFLHL